MLVDTSVPECITPRMMLKHLPGPSFFSDISIWYVVYWPRLLGVMNVLGLVHAPTNTFGLILLGSEYNGVYRI